MGTPRASWHTKPAGFTNLDIVVTRGAGVLDVFRSPDFVPWPCHFEEGKLERGFTLGAGIVAHPSVLKSVICAEIEVLRADVVEKTKHSIRLRKAGLHAQTC